MFWRLAASSKWTLFLDRHEIDLDLVSEPFPFRANRGCLSRPAPFSHPDAPHQPFGNGSPSRKTADSSPHYRRLQSGSRSRKQKSRSFQGKRGEESSCAKN